MNIFTADFKNPPTAFYPVPWWAWNGELEFDEMRRQLDIMREQNIFEFFIFALRGLTKPDFLSEALESIFEKQQGKATSFLSYDHTSHFGGLAFME